MTDLKASRDLKRRRNGYSAGYGLRLAKAGRTGQRQLGCEKGEESRATDFTGLDAGRGFQRPM